MSPGARAAAERELRKRDRQEALASGRMRPGLLYEESEEDEEGEPPLPRRRRPMEGEEGMEFDEVGGRVWWEFVAVLISFLFLLSALSHNRGLK